MNQTKAKVYDKDKWEVRIVNPSLSTIRVFYDGIFLRDETGLDRQTVELYDIPPIPQEVLEVFDFWAAMLDVPVYRREL